MVSSSGNRGQHRREPWLVTGSSGVIFQVFETVGESRETNYKLARVLIAQCLEWLPADGELVRICFSRWRGPERFAGERNGAPPNSKTHYEVHVP